MTVTIVYENKTETYARNMASLLTNSGYNATAIPVAEYPGTEQIKGLPVFFLEKHGKLSYPITGKLSYDKVVAWIAESGV